MDNAQFVAALRRDGDAFAASCAAAGLGTQVDSCPGWTVADLAYHLYEVHGFWRRIVGEARTTWEGLGEPARPGDDELLTAYRDGLDQIVAVLGAVDPAQENWSWADDHTAAFVIRRMAQETAVHRWDADAAAGAPVDIEAELASDGVDEFLEHFVNTAAGGPVGGSVHLHCTDVEGEWTVREAGDSFAVSREHAKGDCALRGQASDLLLVLWRRLSLDAADVVGDAAVAARFVAASRLE